MNYSHEEYMKMYYELTFSRQYFLIFEEYAMKGIVPGFHHLGLGQEGALVGIADEIGEQDWFSATQRNQPICALRFGVKEYLCELFCKKSGFCKGMSGEAHWFSAEKHRGPLSGFLGAAPSIAAGIALAYKLDKRDGCVIIGHGDGTLNEGVVSETLNLVATWKLPVVWFIENNGLAVSTTPQQANAIADLSERAKGFGIPSSSYDGTDVLLVREVMREAVQKARRGEPQLVEFRTTRWLGHYVGSPDSTRDPAIVAEAREKRDPLKHYREYLIGHNIATAEELDAMDKAVDKEIRDAVEYALNQPEKTYEDVMVSPYAEEY